MARIDSSMKAVRATREETYQVKAYIYEYLRDGKAPGRRLEGRQLLTVMLLKAEIEKAIARSAKARQRRRKEASVAAAPAEDLSAIRADESEEEAETEEAPVTVKLNRRQRRLREMALRRMARKNGQKTAARREGPRQAAADDCEKIRILLFFLHACVVAKLFHFKRSPDERADALGIVVADRLAEIIVIRTVAAGVFLHLGSGGFNRGTHARTEACHSAAVGERDGSVRIFLDEFLKNSAIGLDAGVTVARPTQPLRAAFSRE